MVGDLLRIRWVDEQVWFRCKIEGMGDAGRVVQVTYLVDDRWGTYVHALSEVEWERWEFGGAIDPGEADYDMDVWVADDELDHEAAAAASTGCRRQAEEGGGEGREGDVGSSTGPRARATEVERPSAGRRRGEGEGAHGGGADGGGRPSDAAGGFEWVVQAAPKGAGLKKRKALLRALVGLWAEAAGESETEPPAVQKRAIYKEMTKTLSTKQVGVELVVLAKAGLVVVEGYGVRCSERRSGPTSTARRPGGGATGSRADEGSGGRRVAGRRGGSDDGSDTGSTGGGVASEEEEATGRASRGASKRRRDVASYAESEQESEEDEGGGWD